MTRTVVDPGGSADQLSCRQDHHTHQAEGHQQLDHRVAGAVGHGRHTMVASSSSSGSARNRDLATTVTS